LKLFTFSGSSDSGNLAFTSGSSATATGPVAFNIQTYAAGSFTGTLGGVAVSGTNGILNGTGAYAGLTAAITGTGSGTLTLSRGVGQAVSDLITQLTATGTGALATTLTSITKQNTDLATQIASGQAMLARRKVDLTNQFSQMESTVAQMKAAAGSLSGM
jgi:flagellar capping protein FliD